MTIKKKVINKAGKKPPKKTQIGDKKTLFVEEYLSNGGNATKAALALGSSQASAGEMGSRMLKDVEVKLKLDIRRKEIDGELSRQRIERAVAIELKTERLIKEVSRVAFSDIRKIYRPDGTMMMPYELDDDTAAAVQSFEIDSEGQPKYKFWDKNSAQERGAKIIGAFERDHAQQADPLTALLESLSGNVLGVAKS